MDKSIKGPKKRYLATITETIVNSKTLVLEARSPEALRRQIEDEGRYDPDQLDPQTVEVDVEIVRKLPDAQPRTESEKDLDRILTEIAAKRLGIPTLERRWRDSLDFHEVSAWGVKDALNAAFEAGRKSVEEDEDSRTKSADAEPTPIQAKRQKPKPEPS